jgi:hypothetical protein
MARGVYGTAGSTGRVLACVQGPPRQPRCARRRSHRSGPTTRRPSRGDPRRRPPLQHLPAPHRSDIHTSSGTPSRCITRSAAEIHAVPLAAPASKQHEAPSVQIDGGKISRQPKVMIATCRARVPGSPAIAPWGEQRRDVRRRAEYGRQAVPVAAHCHRPVVDK